MVLLVVADRWKLSKIPAFICALIVYVHNAAQSNHKYSHTASQEVMAIYAVLLVLAAWSSHLAFKFSQNLRACKQSGIPYVCMPFFAHGIIAQITSPLWRPTLKLLPKRFRGRWWIFLNPSILWDELYAPFRQVGSDTVLLCAPEGVLLYTAEADVIRQISERRNDFPKPIETYKIIDSKSITLNCRMHRAEVLMSQYTEKVRYPSKVIRGGGIAK
jgi:hypothetical protein